MPEKDNFVTLINPQGIPEQVWDFADGQHVKNMLKMGYSIPEEQKKPTTKKEPQ
jgi:hypothetical protein